MILNYIGFFWNDMYKVVSDVNGVVRGSTINLNGLVGIPEYRLSASESWVPLDADGNEWGFDTNRPSGLYSLEIRDSISLVTVKVIDFEIETPTLSPGRESYIDVTRTIQIDRNQVKLIVSYPYSYFDLTSVNINVGSIFLGEITYNWTDITDPVTDYFTHTDILGVPPEDGQPWTIYRPPSALACDLFVSDISIKQPNEQQADGEITVNASSTGNITYSLDGSPFQASNVFTGLPGGTYIVTIADDTGNCTNQTRTVILKEKYFRIPLLNAIEFKIPDSKRPNFNNTLFVDMALPHRVQKNDFCQVYFDTDLGWVQYQSNIESHEVKIFDYKTKAELAIIAPLKIYDSPEDFSYWEFSINFSLYSGKTIQVQIIPGSETLGNGNVGISEPIKVITSDDENKYVKCQYLSNVNCSDVYWVSGFAPFFYFAGEVANTFPVINKEISRDSEWNVNTQSRELVRKISVKAKQQPYYVFEKLQWALGNGQGPGNYYAINDMWVNSEEAAWDDADFPDKYGLADSEAILEQRDLFTGDLSDTPTPPTTINYLLVNPDNNGGLLVGQNDEYTLV